jgi:hypothetical protein
VLRTSVPLIGALGVMSQTDQSHLAVVESTVNELASTLLSAWTYLNLLRGLHEGSRSNPKALESFSLLFDQIWRAIFDALFAKVGTVVDRTPRTHSLPNLVKLVRKTCGPEHRILLREVESFLAEKAGPISKIENWRHQAVAHRSQNLAPESFYSENKLELAELELALNQLEQTLNQISLSVLTLHVDAHTGPEAFTEQAWHMFKLLSEGISSESQTNEEG